jgi:RHH-type proline utilization regulon transcriptional repressor/proline dehydrogenase/delta 1-pyrroline-5-carboxylate dehydrogenase
MLGEAAMTFADAERYRASYAAAIARLARRRRRRARQPGISVKLSALYRSTTSSTPRQACRAGADRARAGAGASRADIHFTIDAEEAERLELSLDIIEALVPTTRCSPTAGRASASRCSLPEARRAAVRMGRCAGPRHDRR